MKNSINDTIQDLDLQSFSVGNDLVFLPVFLNTFTDLFKAKVYTVKEIEYCELFEDAVLRYASTWAAKEAVYKAIKQLYERPLAFKNIEITRSKIAGIPNVKLPDIYSDVEISLSITHDKDYVFAIALVKRKYD